MKPQHRNLLLAAVLATVFATSLVRLFQYRFSAGDVYPPGSSLRADPLGSKALYDSLSLLPNLRVGRNHEPIGRLSEPSGTTIVVLGVDPEAKGSPMPSDADSEDLDRQVRAGARLVLAFQHQSLESATNVWRHGMGNLRASARGSTNHHERFNVRLGFDLSATNNAGEIARRVGDGPFAVDVLPWAAGWSLDGLSKDWTPLFLREGNAVVAERTLGSGSVVLLATDFPFSNAAMRRGHSAEFLAWTFGSHRRVVFEETHLGLTYEPGVAGLIRKYRLGGAVAGLALLAGLYVWRQCVRFNPPPVAADADTVAGRGSAGGLLNVLRRSVPPSALPGVAFAEWHRSLGRRHALSEQRRADAQEAANLENAKPPGQRDPADFFRRLARILRHR